MSSPGYHRQPLQSLGNPLSTIDLFVKDRVAHVKLNRPKKYNALNAQLFQDILTAFSRINDSSDDIRCVLLYGSGKHFCTGLDL